MTLFSLVLYRLPSLGSGATRWRENLGGGVMAAVTSLPGTIVFGTVAFAPLGDAFIAKGIIASLIGSMILGCFIALFGASRLMIAGPRSYTAIILASVFAALSASGQWLPDQPGAAVALIAIGVITAVLGGLFQVLFGLFQVGKLVKCLPWPVLSGFLNTTALMILLGQLWRILGIPKQTSIATVFASLDGIKVMSVAIAVFTACVVVLAKRKLKGVPAPLVGLLAGSFLYHCLQAFIPEFDAGATLVVIDAGGSFLEYSGAVPPLILGNDLQSHWQTILSAAFSIAVLSSLSTLLCMAGIDGLTGRRSDPNRELLAHGVGNILTAFFGGLPGAGKPGASVLAIRTGADSRITGVVTALVYLLILLVLAPLVSYVPNCVLAGMVVPIAVGFFDDLAKRLVYSLLRGDWRQLRASGSDYLTLSVVVGLGVITDIMMAVASGILLSIILFLIKSSRSLIRQELSARFFRSRRPRSVAAVSLLDEIGERIQVLKLEGMLFFGSANGLLERIEQRVEQGCGYVILDCKRITDIDSTAAELLVRLARSLKQQGIVLTISYLCSGGHIFETLQRHGLLTVLGEGMSFADTDQALEWCEDHLLRRVHPEPSSISVPLADCSLTQGLTCRSQK